MKPPVKSVPKHTLTWHTEATGFSAELDVAQMLWVWPDLDAAAGDVDLPPGLSAQERGFPAETWLSRVGSGGGSGLGKWTPTTSGQGQLGLAWLCVPGTYSQEEVGMRL